MRGCAVLTFASGVHSYAPQEAMRTFFDDLNFMSRVTANSAAGVASPQGCLKGKLAGIHLWATHLAQNEIQTVYTGFNQVGPSAAHQANAERIVPMRSPFGNSLPALHLHTPEPNPGQGAL